MIVIPVGSLSSLTKLYQSVGRWRSALKKESVEWGKHVNREGFTGQVPVTWRLDELPPKGVNLPALTGFLSYANLVKGQFKHPIPTILRYDEYLNSFLNHTRFFAIAKEKGILDYDHRFIEGKMGIIDNLSEAKILVIEGVPENPVDYKNLRELHELKSNLLDLKKEEIEGKVFAIFEGRGMEHISPHFIENLSELTAEIAVNSLVHGASPAFIGVQRIVSLKFNTLKLVVCIADSGSGFVQSFNLSQAWSKDLGISTNLDAVYNACLMSKIYEPGLKDVINEVINNYGGYVNVCSREGEIHWSAQSWNRALESFDNEIFRNILQQATDSLETIDVAMQENYKYGFCRTHKYFLPGTRITFEMNLDL